MAILPQNFYTRADTLLIAQQLLGKHLVTQFADGLRTSGRIVETEAYLGREDRACHAWNGRFTDRTRVMYESGGGAYVYLCYGIHHLFNVITHRAGEPHAILIRGLEPIDGIPTMLQRRGMARIAPRLTAGPGALAKALGIDRSLTGHSLQSPPTWIEDHGEDIALPEIIASPRVGIDYAGEDAQLPYRFRIRNCKWTSPAK
ncbi:MAG: DNA-3-methyladenine glycosylase [Bacteroidota bacterium]